MSIYIVRPKNLIAEPDFDYFDPCCLTDGARIYFERYTEVYYCEDEKEVDVRNMERLK